MAYGLDIFRFFTVEKIFYDLYVCNFIPLWPFEFCFSVFKLFSLLKNKFAKIVLNLYIDNLN